MSGTSDHSEYEARRIAALHAYGILDTEVDERFERLTRLAATLAQVPISLVSLVDTNRQWFKSEKGLGVRETPIDQSFCAHAINHDDVMVVEDAWQDSRFVDNPLVTGMPHIRFYAGAPLRTKEGFNLGTLCIIDSKPRSLSPETRAILTDLAAMVMDELELVRAFKELSARAAALEAAQAELRATNEKLEVMALADGLTGLANRRHFDSMVILEWRRALRTGSPFSLLMIDVDHFKLYNDHYGHPMGDACLQEIARALKTTLQRPGDVAARYGGEEFAVILPDTDAAGARLIAHTIRDAVLALGHEHAASSHGTVTVSIGGATVMAEDDIGVDTVVTRADQALYRAKQSGRNTVCVADDRPALGWAISSMAGG